MGLLDSVMGAVAGQATNAGAIQGVMGQLGDPASLMQMAGGLLGNDGEHGGLQGLIAKFQQGGLGDIVASWVGTGENLPISGEQIRSVLGNDALARLASQCGIDGHALAGHLSSVLPAWIDKLTPDGQAPASGVGKSADLMGMLGGLLKG